MLASLRTVRSNVAALAHSQGHAAGRCAEGASGAGPQVRGGRGLVEKGDQVGAGPSQVWLGRGLDGMGAWSRLLGWSLRAGLW